VQHSDCLNSSCKKPYSIFQC